MIFTQYIYPEKKIFMSNFIDQMHYVMYTDKEVKLKV